MAGYGFAGHIGFGKETTWGTAVAATDYAEALSENINLDIERFEIANIVGRFSEPDDAAGLKRISGNIVVPAHPVSIGHFLKGALGRTNAITVVLSGFLWTSDFRPQTADEGSDNPQPPYTLEIFRDVTSAHRYSGCQFDTMELSMAPNQEVRGTFGLLAKDASVIAKTSPSFPSSSTAPFTFDTASIQIGGAAVSIVEDLTLSFENQLEGIPSLNNSALITRVRRRGPQLARISGTLAFDTITEYQNFVNQTEQAFIMSFFKASSFSMVIFLPKVVYTAFPINMGGRGRVTVGFNGMARYHAGSVHAIRVDLTTTKSNY